MSRNCESSVCPHSLEFDFLNEKYREVLAHNNALREQLNSRMQDPIKYLKLCEELTKVSRGQKSQRKNFVQIGKHFFFHFQTDRFTSF
jgi:uncharacterized protein (DUF1810 family)